MLRRCHASFRACASMVLLPRPSICGKQGRDAVRLSKGEGTRYGPKTAAAKAKSGALGYAVPRRGVVHDDRAPSVLVGDLYELAPGGLAPRLGLGFDANAPQSVIVQAFLRVFAPCFAEAIFRGAVRTHVPDYLMTHRSAWQAWRSPRGRTQGPLRACKFLCAADPVPP